MGYKDKEKEKEYQKGIPRELKNLYYNRRREKNKDKISLKNLRYRLKHGQKKKIKVVEKKPKESIDY